MTLSLCLSFVLSISIFAEPPDDVKKCLNAHENEVTKCTSDYLEDIKDVLDNYGDLIKNNPIALPDPEKKTTCCAVYSLESCVIKAVSPTAGCQKLLQDYIIEYNKEVQQPQNSSVEKVCVKFPRVVCY